MRDIACPLCTDNEFVVVCSRHRGGATYHCVRCAGCGFHYVNPEPDERELSAFYDRDYSEGHECTWHGFEDELNRQVLRLLQDRGVQSLVDLGAGQGRFVRMARDAGLRAEGVEPSTLNCAVARERYGISLQPCTVRQFFDRHPAGLEAVTLLNVLEHLPDPVSVLRQTRASLRPGGVLAVVVPNVDFTLSLGRLRRLAGLRDVYMLESPRFRQQGFDPPVHLSSFNGVSLHRALEHAGFRVDSLRQAAVIRTASPLMNAAKHSVAALGRALHLATGGRLIWGYSLLAIASRTDQEPAAGEPV